MANEVIKALARQRGVFLWEIAEAIGIADSNLSRKLRRELPPQQQNDLLTVVESIAKKKAAQNTES